MYNSDQQMKQIGQATLLTPDEKSTLYSEEIGQLSHDISPPMKSRYSQPCSLVADRLKN